jgi:uncharacterized phage-associated protein
LLKIGYNVGMAESSIMETARKIVELYDRSNGELTPLKLQKLTYYAQAWSLVWDEMPLFDEDFQAWANGPVNPDLYEKHKGTYIIEGDFLSGFSGSEFSGDQIDTIESVLKHYGPQGPFYLSELTHKERPWRKARGDTPPGEPSTAVITKDSMQEYYTGISSIQA